ncbi:MAG: DNA polymerase I [Bacteroidota bacterium]|nr:DNA polymerase I [Bacteroidota bacterium]
MSGEKKLFLLDAYALIYRSYYAFIKNPMYNAEGLNTSCIFGFVNTLEEVLTKEKPTHIAVAFDPAGPNFRHQLYPEYKANRDETPEDIRKSIPYIKDILKAYGIPILQVDGFEADDVIGTLAKKAEADGYQVYMMTPDKDYIQLLSENIFIYKPSRFGNGIEVIDVVKACDSFKLLQPEQFIDILALMGDTSDNIPGAPGVGEKTAIKLVGEFQSVENLFDNIPLIKGKLKDIIVNNKEKIEISKKLARIDTLVPLEVSEEELIVSKPDLEQIKRLFLYLNFKNIEKRVLSRYNTERVVQNTLFDLPVASSSAMVNNFATIETTPHTYYLVDNYEKRNDLIKNLLEIDAFCFDTETTSLDVLQSQIVGMSFSWKKGEAYYVSIPADQNEARKIIYEFKSIFVNDSVLKIGQNIKFDILALKNYGIEVKGKIFDTMLAHYLLQPELRHNMNFLSEQYLNYTPVHIKELIGQKGRHQLNMRNVPAEKIKEYAAEDADVTWQLKDILEKDLVNAELNTLAESLEMPLVLVLADMEFAGVSLNTEALKDSAEILRNDIIELETKIISIAGIDFNISSPKQLGEVLFERLNIDPNAKKTKTKQYSTNEEVLAQLADRHEIIPIILEYRGLRKLLSTYVEALPKMINPNTGKIHTSFNQAVASTGRLSSNDPNLQNIPIREERGREIRRAFVPSAEDYVLLSADYSQIELRIMAHMSKDPNMLEAFRQNTDIHTSTAAKIYGVQPENVSREMRSKAKTANFGIIYGISAFGLSQRLNIPRKEAAELIEGYFKSFPGVKRYMDDSINLAREKGYVETIMGRKRILPDINSNNATVRGMAERNAINSPIQGSAADIIKLAMINIHRQMKRRNLCSKMILQVHDELVFDVFMPELKIVKEIVKYEMENAVKFDIPLLVEMGMGKNWLEAH